MSIAKLVDRPAPLGAPLSDWQRIAAHGVTVREGLEVPPTQRLNPLGQVLSGADVEAAIQPWPVSELMLIRWAPDLRIGPTPMMQLDTVELPKMCPTGKVAAFIDGYRPQVVLAFDGARCVALMGDARMALCIIYAVENV